MRLRVVCGWLLSLGLAVTLLGGAPAVERTDTRSLLESEPRLEGRQMIMILAPSLKAAARPQPAAAPAPTPAAPVARTA